MKKTISAFILILLASACSFDFKTDQQISDAIKKKLNAVSVNVSDGVEANTNGFTGKKKMITVDMGPNTNLTKAFILNTAYQSADTAYQIALAAKDKMSGFFQLNIKGGGVTSDSYYYKTAFLANDRKIEGEIKTFMDAVIQKRYNDLPKYMEGGLDLSPIINLLKNADAGNNGVNFYKFIGMQHTMGVHNPDKKPMEVIQGWVIIRGTGSNAEYPMLFIINPASNQLSSVYINPKK